MHFWRHSDEMCDRAACGKKCMDFEQNGNTERPKYIVGR